MALTLIFGKIGFAVKFEKRKENNETHLVCGLFLGIVGLVLLSRAHVRTLGVIMRKSLNDQLILGNTTEYVEGRVSQLLERTVLRYEGELASKRSWIDSLIKENTEIINDRDKIKNRNRDLEKTIAVMMDVRGKGAKDER